MPVRGPMHIFGAHWTPPVHVRARHPRNHHHWNSFPVGPPVPTPDTFGKRIEVPARCQVITIALQWGWRLMHTGCQGGRLKTLDVQHTCPCVWCLVQLHTEHIHQCLLNNSTGSTNSPLSKHANSQKFFQTYKS